ncbi:MAG: sulfur reduction protein DsrE [Peptoclostridium sp.]|uniref:DsrE-related protein SaoD n=1 Tax=Peptoclostridium sp. TaxID=1904860 RepID=UPI00139DD4F6|nr:DsrE-related protein SaoD [Peptoclostridium sp.]MZQ74560.1 sulfur reduction protein DsrE [Peptoclostridium sp.]
MKVAYVISSDNSRKILRDMIIPQLEQGIHGAEVVGMFFVFDNTFMLLEGTEIGERLSALHEKTGMVLLACDQCAIEREIQDRLVPGAAIGCFPILYPTLGSAGAEQIITL